MGSALSTHIPSGLELALIHLISAAPADPSDPVARLDLEQMRALAQADRFGVHQVVEAPAAADLVLFVETSSGAGHYFERVLRHPVYRRYREKSYLFCSTDRLVPLLPGVFSSIERRSYRRAWTRGSHYLGGVERPALHYEPGATGEWLFSFLGAGAAHPVRREILALRDPRALLVDTAAERARVAAGAGPEPAAGEYEERFARSIHGAKFVLCPRGGGVSSFRLFETMMLGRVPVVVSDQLVLPDGPDWESCSLRVAESEVDSIPALLAAREREAAAMGEAARAVWLDWFSPEVGFHRTVERCLDLATYAAQRRGLRRLTPFAEMLRPFHAARWARHRF
jgi:Exostosin family